MSNSRIHIDQLFSKGLENLEIPIPSNSFDSIRKDIDSDKPANKASFQNFELEVTDADWLKLKERLAKETTVTPNESIEESLQDLELVVTDNDWQILKDRLAKENRKPIIPLPFNEIQSAFKDFEIAVTDSDWKATQTKLKDFRKKKMIWWWWLNMAILGSLIGLAFQYFEPLKSARPSTSQTSISQPQVKVVNPAETPSSAISEDQTKTDHSEKITNLTVNHKNGKAPENQNKPVSQEKTKSEVVKYSSVQLVKKDVIAFDANAVIKNENKVKTDPSSLEEQLSNQTNDNTTKQQSDIAKLENTENPAADLASSINSKSENKVMINGLSNDQAFNSSVNNKTQATQNPAFIIKEKTVNPSPVDTSKKAKPTSKIIPPPPFPSPGFHFYAGITSDVAMTYRKLDKSNDDYYNKIRNNAEKPFAQFSYGLTAGVMKGHDQIQTGISMTEQNFVSAYNYTYPIYDSIPLYGPPPTFVFKGYFLFKKRDTTMHTEEKITIKKMEIPFNYSRTWDLNNKTQFITGVSAIMSFNTKATGSLALNPVNNQLYFYHFQKKSEQQFGFSPGVSLGVQRKLGDHLMMQGNAYGRYTITNRYTNSYSVKENLYSYGLSVKLLYLINK